MKIVHICLCGPVMDGWAYQDNLLAKYQRISGHDVTIISSEWIYNEKGIVTKADLVNYYNKDYVKMIRLKSRFRTNINSKLKLYSGLYEALKNENPDIIFIHGCQFLDIRYIIKYKKNNAAVKIYIDNHADLANSAKNWFSKNILHRMIWRRCAQNILKYTEKYYGVSPARVDFLIDVYKLPENKVELLVMGADDERVIEAQNDEKRRLIRKKHNIREHDFLVITGGKIDHNKPQTLLLMESVNKLQNDNIKLIVFGSVIPELKSRFDSLLSDTVQYIGWLNTSEAYDYFYAGDLVVFPGLHSVYWEQAVGLGKPCVFKYIEGFTHIDLGGNCKFIHEDSVDEITRILNQIIHDRDIYENMKYVANTKGKEVFSYSNIAEKCLL